VSPAVVIAAVLLLALVVFKLIAARPRMPATAAYAAVQQDTAVEIDVREPEEWADGVAAPAVLLPLSDLRGARHQWRPFLEKHRDKQLLVYCHSGMRSGAVASTLRREGYDAVNIGGFSGWKRAALPTRVP
jgi:rhodanese-related sulfurtransferase